MSNSEREMNRFMIEEGGINEVLNSGLVAQATMAGRSRLHDEDPAVRRAEKVALAGEAGGTFIKWNAADGRGTVTADISCDPSFVSSIALAVMNDLENMPARNSLKECVLNVSYEGGERAKFEDLVSKIDSVVDGISVRTSDMPAAGGRKTYDLRKVMTSQLAAIWLETRDDRFRDEYLRRIRMCGLGAQAAQAMFDYEAQILRKYPRPEMTDPDFVRKPLFTLSRPVLSHHAAYYEKNFEYTLSHIIKMNDEAEWHFWNSHELDLSDEVWGEINMLSDKNKALFIPYAMDLIDNHGWANTNVNAFSFNEQGMLDLIRWNRNMTAASSDPWDINKLGIEYLITLEAPEAAPAAMPAAAPASISAAAAAPKDLEIEVPLPADGLEPEGTADMEPVPFAAQVPAPAPEPEPAIEAAPVPEPVIEAAPEPAAVPEPVPEPAPAPEPEPTPEPDIEAEPEPTPEPVIEAEQEPEPEPAPEEVSYPAYSVSGITQEMIKAGTIAVRDGATGESRIRIPVSKDGLWQLSVYLGRNGELLKYSMDHRALYDRFYVFTDEDAVRSSLYREGDENRYLHEIIRDYMAANRGDRIVDVIPVTAQFEFR